MAINIKNIGPYLYINKNHRKEEKIRWRYLLIHVPFSHNYYEDAPHVWDISCISKKLWKLHRVCKNSISQLQSAIFAWTHNQSIRKRTTHQNMNAVELKSKWQVKHQSQVTQLKRTCTNQQRKFSVCSWDLVQRKM